MDTTKGMPYQSCSFCHQDLRENAVEVQKLAFHLSEHRSCQEQIPTSHCPCQKVSESLRENLYQVLQGRVLQNSLYVRLKVKRNK